MNICHDIFYYFHLQIEKVTKLQIGVDKLVGKVSIHLLHHAKSATYIVSIIIDVPAVVYIHS